MKSAMSLPIRAAFSALRMPPLLSTLWALPLCLLCTVPAVAQTPAVSASQRAAAQQAAQAGIPLAELTPDAPDSYIVKAGDTLWAIAGLFLKSPWRWPELWGMNMQDIRNPHRIFPGQQLFLDRSNGRARLRAARAAAAAGDAPTETIKVAPRTRFSSVADAAIPTLSAQAIEPFLAEPLIVAETTLNTAPRIVATQEGRVMLSRGDRAYARSSDGTTLVNPERQSREFRVFRNAVPLRDPQTRAVLGYEAQYVGRAVLVRGESSKDTTNADGKTERTVVPATIDIVGSKEEMRTGDRLLPEPPRQLTAMCRAPENARGRRVVSMYGSAVANAAQNQIVVINKGTADGIESGHVLAILKDGQGLVDRTGDKPTVIKLPDERNGLLMVFRPFEKLSYALILEITDGVKVGDRVVNPR
jgi:hypothetical protein